VDNQENVLREVVPIGLGPPERSNPSADLVEESAVNVVELERAGGHQSRP
jgi:hypothetical protein